MGLLPPRWWGWAVGALAGLVMATIITLAFGGHQQRAERQERVARDSVAVARADAARWRRIAEARSDTLTRALLVLDSTLMAPPERIYVPRVRVRRDTVRVGQATASIPIDSAGRATEVDAYVPASAYDTLAARCTQTVRACTATVAAKDSVIGALERERAAQAAVERALRRQAPTGWRRLWRDAQVAGASAVVGAVACVFFCPR